jgi:protein-L-isoaspartate(D-aspartate) O-methyltransferase
VLDIGTGLGYAAAVIGRMGAQVTALEEEAVVAGAEAALAEAGAEGVRVLQGPLAQGAPDAAPFDAILIEGAAEIVPDAILDQLKEDGRIGVLISEGGLVVARIGRKEGGHVHWRYAFHAGAPVLPGFRRATAFVL